MLRTASSLPPKGLSTPGSDPASFPAKPPACYRASWQLPGPDFHRQATTSLRTRRNTMHYVTVPPPVLLGARKGLNDPSIESVEVEVFENDPSIGKMKDHSRIDIDGVEVDSWYAVLDLEPRPMRGEDETIARIEEVLSAVLPRVQQWAANASIDDPVNLTPPTREALASWSTGEPLDRNLLEQYRWAVDHFAKTFFRDWKTTSLHYELRWLDGDILPPCPNELMLDRRVSREEITQEIARRTVYENRRPDPAESLVYEMSRHALKLLRQGYCREAAAVFEFGVQQRLKDPDVRNNLGFCLIPIEPRRALEHLKAAANMGYQSSEINAYNQIC